MSETFILVAVLAVAIFSMKTFAGWANLRHDERRMHERYALLARLAEQPRENADLVIALLREEEASDEQRRMERRRSRRREGMKAGALLMAVGTGLGIFLANLDASEPVWLIGLMLVLMGAVLSAFAFFGKTGSARQ